MNSFWCIWNCFEKVCVVVIMYQIFALKLIKFDSFLLKNICNASNDILQNNTVWYICIILVLALYWRPTEKSEYVICLFFNGIPHQKVSIISFFEIRLKTELTHLSNQNSCKCYTLWIHFTHRHLNYINCKQIPLFILP